MPLATDRTARKAELHRRNAERAIPLQVCADCGFPSHKDDLEWLFHGRLCTSCAWRRVEELLYKAAKRLGRKAVLKALKKLAKS
jgi:hypothetical protein